MTYLTAGSSNKPSCNLWSFPFPDKASSSFHDVSMICHGLSKGLSKTESLFPKSARLDHQGDSRGPEDRQGWGGLTGAGRRTLEAWNRLKQSGLRVWPEELVGSFGEIRLDE